MSSKLENISRLASSCLNSNYNYCDFDHGDENSKHKIDRKLNISPDLNYHVQNFQMNEKPALNCTDFHRDLEDKIDDMAVLRKSLEVNYYFC